MKRREFVCAIAASVCGGNAIALAEPHYIRYWDRIDGVRTLLRMRVNSKQWAVYCARDALFDQRCSHPVFSRSIMDEQYRRAADMWLRKVNQLKDVCEQNWGHIMANGYCVICAETDDPVIRAIYRETRERLAENRDNFLNEETYRRHDEVVV